MGVPAPAPARGPTAPRGAKVEQTKLPMGSKVVDDRELMTGQDPYSAKALAAAFIAKICATLSQGSAHVSAAGSPPLVVPAWPSCLASGGVCAGNSLLEAADGLQLAARPDSCMDSSRSP